MAAVYPTFPVSPTPGQTFTPEGTSQVWTYISAQVGWVKTKIDLQPLNSGYPVWPGDIVYVPHGGGGGAG